MSTLTVLGPKATRAKAGTSLSFALVSLMLFATASAQADWIVGDPAKWIQMPDLSTNGLDVSATLSSRTPADSVWRMLADDFECTSVGPITDIHIWGSWYDDRLPQREAGQIFYPTDVAFSLTIWSDIPEVPDVSPSMPGELLWEHEFFAGQFTASHWATTIEGEGWYDPSAQDPYEFPGDFQIWQYNFSIDPRNTFIQSGSEDRPVVYWLGASAFPLHQDVQETMFGWKTSVDHWNDDAVWMDDPLEIPRWRELEYPQGHAYHGQSMDLDLAFVIVPEPSILGLLLLGSLTMLRRQSA